MIGVLLSGLLAGCNLPAEPEPGINADAPQIVSFTADPPSIGAANQPVTLRWEITGSPTSLELQPGIGPVSGTNTTVTPAAETEYTLTASNRAGAVSASLTVTLDGTPEPPEPPSPPDPPPPDPPSPPDPPEPPGDALNADFVVSARDGLRVQFNAGGSSAPGGTIESYEWDFGDDRPNITTSASVYTRAFLRGGEYQVTLSVTAEDGATDSVTKPVSVTAGEGENGAPTVTIAGDEEREAVTGQAVALSATGSDPDGDPLSYAWSAEPAAGVSFSAPDAADTNVSFSAAGDYTVTVTVDDGDGGTASSAVTFTVEAAETPTLSADAGEDLGGVVGETVTLDGSASEGEDLSFSWDFVTTPPGSTALLLGDDTATPSFTPNVAGDYVLELTLTGVNGEVDTDTVTIQVSAAGSLPEGE